MRKIIIFPEAQGVAIINPMPECPLPIEAIARKDVPAGAPYRIVTGNFFDDQIAQGVSREDWAADFDHADGHGDTRYGTGTEWEITEFWTDDAGMLMYRVRHIPSGKETTLGA